jgi:hypothetical protein
MAPELIFFSDSVQNVKSAIWSIGIIALDLLINIKKFPSHQNLFFYYVRLVFLNNRVQTSLLKTISKFY